MGLLRLCVSTHAYACSQGCVNDVKNESPSTSLIWPVVRDLGGRVYVGTRTNWGGNWETDRT